MIGLRLSFSLKSFMLNHFSKPGMRVKSNIDFFLLTDMQGPFMNETKAQYVISIMSRDRVGIVYEVSKAISDLGGNIADVRQSVLCGYFSMILLAAFPIEISQNDIECKLTEVDSKSETNFEVAVKRVQAGDHKTSAPMPEHTYVLTAKGDDQIGLVATVSEFCSRHNVNILDLSTTVSDGAYVMILLIDMSRCSISDVRADLPDFMQQSGLNVVLQHHDIFRAVNEVN